MIDRQPSVSVVIPAYNAGPYIRDTLDSILGQTFQDFEVIVVDDGSTDDTAHIVSSINDKRIATVVLEENMGVRKAFRKGIDAAKGKYIMRCDADDISLPHRMSLQHAFLEEHEEVDVLGGNLELFGSESGIWTYPVAHNAIVSMLAWSTGMSQSTLMIRRTVFTERHLYQEMDGPSVCEDWQYYYKIKDKVRFANTGGVLVKYRRGEQNISKKLVGEKDEIMRQMFRRILKDMGFEGTGEEVDLHRLLAGQLTPLPSPDQVRAAATWKEDLISKNREAGLFDPHFFDDEVRAKWDRLFYLLLSRGKPLLDAYVGAGKMSVRKWYDLFKWHIKNNWLRKS